MELKEQTPELMDGVPRGLSSKYLKDQSIPQARWQAQEAICSHPALRYDPANPQGKILLGAIGGQLIGIADDRHMQTIAGTRAGKSVTVIANLLHYDGSVLMIDPKGEGANKTARRRVELGQDVFVLDPFDRTRGPARKYRAKYNPLSALTLDSETIIEDAMQIVDGLIVSDGQEKDPHWNESAGAALLEAGTLLRAAQVALLASQGIAEVPIYRPPAVSVMVFPVSWPRPCASGRAGIAGQSGRGGPTRPVRVPRSDGPA